MRTIKSRRLAHVSRVVYSLIVLEGKFKIKDEGAGFYSTHFKSKRAKKFKLVAFAGNLEGAKSRILDHRMLLKHGRVPDDYGIFKYDVEASRTYYANKEASLPESERTEPVS